MSKNSTKKNLAKRLKVKKAFFLFGQPKNLFSKKRKPSACKTAEINTHLPCVYIFRSIQVFKRNP